MEFISAFLEKIEPVYIILAIFFILLVFIGCKFKELHCCYKVMMSVLLILVFFELAAIIQVQKDIIIIPDSAQKFLFVSVCATVAIIFLIFDKDKIKDKSFILIVGLPASIQTVISMNISNSDKYFLYVKMFHGAAYIFIPVFLVYVITSGSKDIIEMIKSNKEIIESYNKVIEENRRDMQEIKKVILSNEKQVKKSKFCKLFKFHSN